MALSLPQYSLGATINCSLSISNKIISTAQLWNGKHSTYNSRPTFLQLPLKKRMEVARNGGWRIRGSDDGSCGVEPYMPPPSPSALYVVKDFYVAINSRDMNKLDQILSKICHYEDLIFYIPFEGKEGVKRFLSTVLDAMGPNGHIAIDRMAEGEGLTATVFWHIEWKNKEIPFTNGCGLFECEEVGGKILIRKITGLEELPLKPGDLVLKLMKAITTFFDLYPFAAEALLGNSHGSHEGLDKLLDMLRKKFSN